MILVEHMILSTIAGKPVGVIHPTDPRRKMEKWFFFLCNTFFSTDQMPSGFRQVISLLPLSQASNMIRAISTGMRAGWFGYAVLLTYLAVFSALSVMFIYKKKNL